MCLPLYALFVYISLLVPASFPAFEILITFTEGLSLMTIFALIGKKINLIY